MPVPALPRGEDKSSQHGSQPCTVKGWEARPACWLRWLCALLLTAPLASAPWCKHIGAHRSGIAPARRRQPRPPTDTSTAGSPASGCSGRPFNRIAKLSETCALR